jgi:hypothetical protein
MVKGSTSNSSIAVTSFLVVKHLSFSVQLTTELQLEVLANNIEDFTSSKTAVAVTKTKTAFMVINLFF